MTTNHTKKSWTVYMVKCADNTIYTGITNNLEKRIAAHNSPNQGAKYTRSRQPVRLLYKTDLESKSEALKEEYRIKQLSRAEKLKLSNQI